jgi:hypothetical protein
MKTSVAPTTSATAATATGTSVLSATKRARNLEADIAKDQGKSCSSIADWVYAEIT